MLVTDAITKQKVDRKDCVKIVIGQTRSGSARYGYTTKPKECVRAWINRAVGTLPVHWDKMKGNLFFSNRQGIYMSKLALTEVEIVREKNTLGVGIFPYSFPRRYEAVENFRIFNGKQHIVGREKKYPLENHLGYTFGLEFETSGGIIPENICIRDGLIPLRDGSIDGLEYSTVVLEGHKGLALLEQQLDTLKEYTDFNKECSLHIHLGGFPQEPEKIYAVARLCYLLQGDIASLVPALTFDSAKYKKSGKDYCKRLPLFGGFGEMYEHLVGRKYFGDLNQPHPNDSERNSKWRIPTRYYWMNLVNMVCYKVNKTVEFRLLRPTFNYRKITLWLYIFNAILKYAENYTGKVIESDRYMDVEGVLREIYEPEVAEKLSLELEKLRVLVTNQRNSGDSIGAMITMENKVFPEKELL